MIERGDSVKKAFEVGDIRGVHDATFYIESSPTEFTVALIEFIMLTTADYYCCTECDSLMSYLTTEAGSSPITTIFLPMRLMTGLRCLIYNKLS